MRGINYNDDNDYHYIYDDELYPKEISTPRKPGTPTTQTTPPVILDPPPEISTQRHSEIQNFFKYIIKKDETH